MVTGLFTDRQSVERAYQCVVERGYDTGDINVVMSDDTRKRYFSGDRQIDIELGSKVAEGGELGGPIGGTVGTVIPVLVGRRWRCWPGGGLIGALSDWGIPEDRIHQYEAGIHEAAF